MLDIFETSRFVYFLIVLGLKVPVYEYTKVIFFFDCTFPPCVFHCSPKLQTKNKKSFGYSTDIFSFSFILDYKVEVRIIGSVKTLGVPIKNEEVLQKKKKKRGVSDRRKREVTLLYMFEMDSHDTLHVRSDVLYRDWFSFLTS